MRDGGGRGGRREECELEDEFGAREASCFVIDVRGSCDDFRSASRNLKKACASGSVGRIYKRQHTCARPVCRREL